MHTYKISTLSADQWATDTDFAQAWLELFEILPDASFYHHPDWLRAANQQLLAGDIQLQVAYDDQQLLAILPLTRRGWPVTLQFPAHDHLTLGDLLLHPSLDPAAALNCIDQLLADADASHARWLIINLPETASLFTSLPAQTGSNESAPVDWQQRPARDSAWFNLHTEKLPPGGKLKRNLKRLRKKGEEQGALTAVFESDPERLAAAFATFLELEASGWKGAAGEATAIASNPDLRAFYQQLLSPLQAGITPCINMLWQGERCIAAQLALRTGTRLSLLKIAYDESCAAFSPGSLLLEDVITQAADDGIQILSLVTSPPWATRWHPHTTQVWHVTRYNNLPGGRLLHALDRLKLAAKARLRPEK